ncbi:hypothetical protein ABIF66_008850 [Bradyrhizobium japonicum]|uniref:hypothetical protein n=1 Tax=Bradyrhizobium liaoningense TaxID=43992 RepID=UPI001BAB54EE|nr:hypothetical protein [Bradyrhizobium liaoningense]MBR1070234.1 hypothetical protein [Bradyrhizobium liaoningense]
MRTIAELIDLALRRERQAEAIELEPVELEPSPSPPQNETAMARWRRLNARPASRSESIEMNAIARSMAIARPPRAPGQQGRKFNGLWWYGS